MADRRSIPDNVRDALLVDAMHRCCLCPEHHDIVDAHHIVPVSENGTDDDWNLLVLCANHHRQLHYATVEWPEGTKRPPAVVITGDRYPIRWHR